MPWIATGPGKSFRPLRFAPDGWSELMRLAPGSAVTLHRHTGEVHAFNISGTQRAVYLAWCRAHDVPHPNGSSADRGLNRNGDKP